MNDLDDDALLEEIKALEDALVCDEASSKNFLSNVNELRSWNHEKKNTSLFKEEIKQDVHESILGESSLSHAERAYNLNLELIEHLLEAYEEVTMNLEECQNKLDIVENCLTNEKSLKSKMKVVSVGMPYFKDKSYFAAKPNFDAQIKAANGELQVATLQKICLWTMKERCTLFKAICQEVLNSRSDFSMYFDIGEIELFYAHLDKAVSDSHSLIPEGLKQMIKPIGSKEYDWLKIALENFDNKHSDIECYVMWNSYLHPDINKTKWTQKESNTLLKLANIKNFQDWDNIAKELDTNRSGYQCFVRYNGIKGKLKNKICHWTLNEDKQLKYIIDNLKIGDYIPWSEVTHYMYPRSKQQVYFRWTYSLCPQVKKGRFTHEEDESLIMAVTKYGNNFNKISASILPHRTHIQLRERYQTLITKEKGKMNIWTIDEDQKLIYLFDELGPKWSEIALNFPSKNRTQVRHRYCAISRWARNTENGTLCKSEIKRELNATCIGSFTTTQKSEVDNVELSDIDKQLIEYFQFILVMQTKAMTKLTFHSVKDLDENVEQLYNVLKSLDASLQLPENFHMQNLSDVDVQLLKSLKSHIEETNNKKYNDEFIEKIRLQMFGTCSDIKEHFIPPPPFGIRTIKESKKSIGTINYSLNKENYHRAEVSDVLETPVQILKFIGLEDNLEFKRISQMLISNSVTEFHKIGEKNINSSTEMKTTLESCDNKHFLSEKQFIEDHMRFFKPSFSTILGYRYLKSFVDFSNFEESVNIGNDIAIETEEEVKAYNLLKKRLIYLFQYVADMSSVVLLGIHGKNTIFNNFDAEQIPRGNTKKRKMYVKNVLSKKLRINS